MLDFNLKEDLRYIIGEWGTPIKINNEKAKGLINNSDLQETTDDKKLITEDKVNRGDYVQMLDTWYLTMSESNVIRYGNHYKALIRTCNYSVIFTIDKRLYYYPVYTTKERFGTRDGGSMGFLSNAIVVSFPHNDITNKIKEDDRFIVMDRVWKIKNVDYTKRGIVSLYAEIDQWNDITDDRENGIVNKNDLIDDTIIYPFDEEETPPEPSEDYEITIDGYDDIASGETETWTAIVKSGGEVVDKGVVWSIINDNNAKVKIVRQDEKSCDIKCEVTKNYVTFILRATIIDDEEQYEEMEIQVTRW